MTTPQLPQRLYLITEDELALLVEPGSGYSNYRLTKRNEIAARVRSSPAAVPVQELNLNEARMSVVADVSKWATTNQRKIFGSEMVVDFPDLLYHLNEIAREEFHLKVKHADTIRQQAAAKERERVLPTEKELHALKHAVCCAIAEKIEGFEIADNYYHKLKSLCGEQEPGEQ